MRQGLRKGQAFLGTLLFCATAGAADVAWVEIKPVRSWDGGYTADVYIHNLGDKPIDGWTLSFDISNKLRSAYSAKLSGKGPYYFKSLDYNAKIPVGGKEGFGFVAEGGFADAKPRNCRINGQSCRFKYEPGNQIEVQSVSSPSVTEGAPLEFAVALSGKSSSPVAVGIELRGIEVSLGSDIGKVSVKYPGQEPLIIPGSAALVVPAGVDRFTVILETLKDAAAEGTERVMLRAAAQGTPQSASGDKLKWVEGIGSINDELAGVDLSFSDANLVKEGEVAACMLTLSGQPTQELRVRYATVDGSATAASGDYLAVSKELVFAPGGQLTQMVPVQTLRDQVNPEADETLQVRILEANGARITRPDCKVTIRNDLPPDWPEVAVMDANSVKEGESASFTVRLSRKSANAVTVSYQTVDGTAKSGEGDYKASAGILTFNANEQEKKVTVQTLGDSSTESNENFSLKLSAVQGATIARGEATGTIIDVPTSLPTISLVGPSGEVAEGTMAQFQLTVSAPAPTADVVVKLKTSDGSAKAGSDYTAVDGQWTLRAGSTAPLSIPVTVLSDTTSGEPAETFKLSIASVSPNAKIGSVDATATIKADDGGGRTAVLWETFKDVPIGEAWLPNGCKAVTKRQLQVLNACGPGGADDKCLVAFYDKSKNEPQWWGFPKDAPTDLTPEEERKYAALGGKCSPYFTGTGTDVLQSRIPIGGLDAANSSDNGAYAKALRKDYAIGVGKKLDVVAGKKPASTYSLNYDVKFTSSSTADRLFDWARAGKLPGLTASLFDSGCSAANAARNNAASWSVRVMWRALGKFDGKVVAPSPKKSWIEMYRYSQEREDDECGTRKYAESTHGGNAEIESNKWYSISVFVKLNTVRPYKGGEIVGLGNTDGEVHLYVYSGGSLIGKSIAKNVALRDVDHPASLIHSIFFSTFYGGNEQKRVWCQKAENRNHSKCNTFDPDLDKYSWASDVPTQAYFDNFAVYGGDAPRIRTNAGE